MSARDYEPSKRPFVMKTTSKVKSDQSSKNRFRASREIGQLSKLAFSSLIEIPTAHCPVSDASVNPADSNIGSIVLLCFQVGNVSNISLGEFLGRL